jgi:hypothetical protein
MRGERSGSVWHNGRVVHPYDVIRRCAAAVQEASRNAFLCMLFLFALVGVLRLALLSGHPVPAPAGADDFSYLLLGDTLAHFRLANAAHPMRRFFETNYVLQDPAYSSVYPIGQGMVLAFGQLVFGLPWAGVLISTAMISALCYWMLRGWTSAGWALVGGLLAAWRFGPLNSWMNCYWGGAVFAIAGCLVYGSLPRLQRRERVRDSVVLGLGMGAGMLSRPYESLFLAASVALFFLPELRRRKEWTRLARMAAPALLALLPAVALQLAHDHAVTGSWLTIPYQLSRWQYGVPATFTFQRNAVPHVKLTPAQQLYYEGQAAAHGGGETPARYFKRLGGRVRYYGFFFAIPALAALPFFLPSVRRWRHAWIAVTCALFALGTNFYPYFFPHYVAALACLFVLMTVLGLERLSRMKSGRIAAGALVGLCGVQFAFWYTVHAQGDERVMRALARYETGDGINYGDPQGRIAIDRQLAEAPGRQLVFVRYYSTHGYEEWIHNGADIDGARVVRALDLGPLENEKLKSYYPGRKVWLLLPDAEPPRLVPYPGIRGFENAGW